MNRTAVRLLPGVALLLCLITSLASADVKIKAATVYKPYEKIVLTADGVTDKAQILWDVSGDADVEEVGNKLYVWAKPGSYTVTMTAIDFDSKKITRARTNFAVVPDGPPPPPPPPADPLAAAFQKAYTTDVDADRAVSLAFLQSAYSGMAAQAGARPEKTNAAFITWMKTVVEAPSVGLKAVQLKGLRTAIGTELAATWGSAPQQLAPTDAAKELTKISNALAQVK